MKRYIALFVIALLACTKVLGAPGDTTVLNICKNVQLTSGDYNYPQVFPDTSKHFRKIWLTFTLGRYICPGSSQKNCGAWDNGIIIFWVPKNRDIVDISQIITPYASSAAGNPFDSSWRYNYLFDVTDYAPLFHDSATIRIYTGGVTGFSGGITMTFIEGIPPRQPILVQNAWATDTTAYLYGKLGDDINTQIDTLGFRMPPGATQATLINTISGHGNNKGTACSEFCSKWYKLFLNNNQLDSTEIWRTDCGYDNLGYPQTGTWVFNRGGWCPGASVDPLYHELKGLNPGDTFTMNMTFQPYPNPDTSSNAHYKVNSQVIFFKPTAFTLDASVEYIKSPSTQSETYMYNPICSSPIVTIRNTGSTQLISLVITYGIDGDSSQTYTWTGHLDFLQLLDVTLPPLKHYQNLVQGSIFRVTISSPNGSTDQYALNNVATSQIGNVAPMWNNFMIITLKTNNSTSSITGYNETAYTIYDANENVVFQRNNLNNGATYKDTIYLKGGCYKFNVTDDGCDGINWWYYAYYTPNPGDGSLQIRKLYGNTYYTPSHYHGGDFGCGFTDEFIVPDNTGTNNIALNNIKVRLVNNPTDDKYYMQYNGDELTNVQVNIFDALGHNVSSYPHVLLEPNTEFSARNLANGIYFVSVKSDKINTTMRLVVQHK